ncbi:hypothetical protein HMPREF9374_3261 [Desmospora sp. 8437]|nr:hypothetical protein HMPREF9374_3261 [Desmospora sp. 8437]
MGKWMVVALSMVAVMGMLTGCGDVSSSSSGQDSPQEALGEMNQAQRIEVKSVASDQVQHTLTEKKELEKFVAKQRIEEWESESRIPKGAKPSYEYIFYQEETVKAGEKKEKDAPLHEVARLIT